MINIKFKTGSVKQFDHTYKTKRFFDQEHGESLALIVRGENTGRAVIAYPLDQIIDIRAW